MNPGFACRGTAVPSSTMRTSFQPPIFLIEDTCEYTDISIYIRYSLSNLFKTNVLYISGINVYIYIHCSICICSIFNHFRYRAPDLNAWNHLTWYSEDRTLQWLQALRAEINPHHIHGHEFCHREEDQSTIAITRAIMDRVGATITTQAVATSSTTAPAPGTSTAPTPSELASSGRNIPSSYQFITSDSDADSNGIPQILSEDEATPPVSSDQPPLRKVVLKRKLKKKAAKAKGEDKATVKAPKIKRKKKADATKSPSWPTTALPKPGS